MNFTSAARELSVSQAAVSRRIKNLERHIGVELFHRDGRKISLTPKGKMLFRRVQVSLDYLGAELEDIADADTRSQLTVTLYGPPEFSHLWLSPKIADFSRANPNVQLRLYTSHAMFELRSDEDDLVIFYSDRDISEWRLTPLFWEELVPMAAPDYLRGMGLAGGPREHGLQDLIELDLLDYQRSNVHSVTLGDWFAHALGRDARINPRVVYPSYAMAVDAALAGYGVILGCRGMLAHYLDQGRLVEAHQEGRATGFGFHIGFPTDAIPGKTAATLARYLTSFQPAAPDTVAV